MNSVKYMPSSMGLDFLDELAVREDSRYDKRNTISTRVNAECVYCNDRNDLLTTKKDGSYTSWAHIDDGELYLIESENRIMSHIKINYCPMCGRSL